MPIVRALRYYRPSAERTWTLMQASDNEGGGADEVTNKNEAASPADADVLTAAWIDHSNGQPATAFVGAPVAVAKSGMSACVIMPSSFTFS